MEEVVLDAEMPKNDSGHSVVDNWEDLADTKDSEAPDYGSDEEHGDFRWDSPEPPQVESNNARHEDAKPPERTRRPRHSSPELLAYIRSQVEKAMA